jgi:metallophosphoesterase (TIGR00282 family)
VGILPRQAEAILDAGADVITLGNHSYSRKEIARFLDDNRYILRPANDSPLYPGRGVGVYDSRVGPITVMNLIGRCNMAFGPDNPFLLAEKLLKQIETKIVLLDFHAEASSEKLAMGWHLDGRVSAVWGTHTHVPTADDMILPKGTGYVSDLGMTGPIFSILGIRPEQSVATFRGGLNSRYETAPGPCKLEGVLFTLDSVTGRCTGTERIWYHDTDSARG